MPRPTLPPTPASSTDIKGQDGSNNLNSLQLSFELPPPAIIQDASRISPKGTRTSPNADFQSILPSKTASYPVQPSETVKSRRRSSAAQRAASNQTFALPPPPTRSRKIIQMKPRAAQEEPEEAPVVTGPKSGTSGSGKAVAAAAAAGTATTVQGKKKQPSTTSAAGRKIARKTAHSLIERRRRSKMNEEFAVLKGMIPACTGEMHKLAILQASIEYVRYLEDCVAKLKAQRDASEARSPTESGLQTPAGRGDSWGPIPQFLPKYQEDPDDVEMTDSEASSPVLLPQDATSRHRHDSYSSVSTDHTRQHNYSTSTTTSPAFGPQTYVGYRHGGGLGSALTSPALTPQRDLDQEATAALLMLNSDRRGTVGDASIGASAGAVRSAGRGMSVRDLLST
ncbi:helix-loop-helix DNA-binding domain-containing protein [Colletotrichum graminicola M1.001]|uniref:Helix-loop-helix DNA-binding domain-containing protein n=1 Tax=Colletotrichum graminicola (strain M1.001 / M2 / FGSC 10212) TaxID=645133 RepID=E3QD54_COLGM|nr:helix-loop-helix DNA-binding domain-containing protein [Colletotrichum graminicola M1.001]EFQ28826.1 helix-loop-helix DNA-binding domain-containing protein [Colletotrichum graminicola M1.001]